MSVKELRDIDDVLNDENIVSCEDFHKAVDFVFGKVASSVSKTLGPGGGFTLISSIEASVPVYPTKDGYTVMHEYKFNDQLKFFIAEIIKDISRTMNLKVGDGTTSGIIIAYELYRKLIKYDITKLYPEIGCILPTISMRTILEESRKVIEKYIREDKYCLLNPSDIDKETENNMIREVANISSNNDSTIGDLVSDMYINRACDHVYITVEANTKEETVVDKEVGFKFNGGFITPNMANQIDRIVCKLENPRFLIVDGPLTLNDLPNLNKIINYVLDILKCPIVIIAKDYDDVVRKSITDRSYEGTIQAGKNGPFEYHKQEPIACLTIDTSMELSKERFEDLRIILGGEVLNTKKGQLTDFSKNFTALENYLGGAKEYYGTQLTTRIKGGKGDKGAVRARIQILEDKIKDIDANEGMLTFAGISSLKHRISMLNSDMSVIKVGGASDKERRARKLIFDDVVAACGESIKHGFALGGNVAVPFILVNKRDVILTEIVDSLINSKRNIIVGNNRENVTKIVNDFLDVISDSFKKAYSVAISNMVGIDTKSYNEITAAVYDNFTSDEEDHPVVFDLVGGSYGFLGNDHTMPVVPGNTDFELMNAVFCAVGIFISANQFLNVYPGKAEVYRSAKN